MNVSTKFDINPVSSLSGNQWKPQKLWEPTASPVLTKWWNWELTLATNFGNHAQMVPKFGGQIWVTNFSFVPDWLGTLWW